MTHEEKIAAIEAAIRECRTPKIVDIYNDYARENNYEEVYQNDEDTLNMLFSTPADAVMHLDTKYRTFHDYCKFDGTDYLQSCYYPEDEGWFDIDEIAKWLADSPLLYRFIDRYDLDLDCDELESEDNAD